MRLSLLKSATMPDATADQRQDRFTYAPLPHVGNTRIEVRREACALNLAPRVFAGPGQGAGIGGPLLPATANGR